MVRLRSIGVLSCAKVFAVVQAAVGILVGLFFLLFGIVGAAIAPSRHKFGVVGVIVIAVFMPIFYAVLGFVMGAIWAFLYNLTANAIGGLELEFETPSAASPVSPPQGAAA